MENRATQIVHKLWSYCNILRDDGLSYPDYVEQLTYLLFLKMADEREKTKGTPIIPPEHGWDGLVKRHGREMHGFYSDSLKSLRGKGGMLGTIFHDAENKIRDPSKLELLVQDLINSENWSELNIDVKGEAYEGLLERNAQDTKTGAGQYFTPRPVIEAIVECVEPSLGEAVYDPACGTGGFLLGVHAYLVKHNTKLSKAELKKLRLYTFRGVELVHTVARLAAMNLLLHGIGPEADETAPLPIVTADSLVDESETAADVILTNPPFGRKSSVTMINEAGERERQTLDSVRSDIDVSTSNKQLNFLQHVMSSLNPGGRAAVVIPDNVLFEGGAGEAIRRKLLDGFNVHTLLRLPAGLFYAQGVRTNVLFFDRPTSKFRTATRKLLVYDLRTNMHFSLRTNRLETKDLKHFIETYKGPRRNPRRAGKSPDANRWRVYDVNEIVSRDKCNFDIVWIQDDVYDEFHKLPNPDVIAAEINEDLRAALSQLEEIHLDFAGAFKAVD